MGKFPGVANIYHCCGVFVCGLFSLSPSICGRIQVEDTLLGFGGRSSQMKSSHCVVVMEHQGSSRKLEYLESVSSLSLSLYHSSPRGRRGILCLPFHCLQRLLETSFNDCERENALLWSVFQQYQNRKSIL